MKAHIQNKSQQATVLHHLFGLQITSQRFDLQITSAVYPRKLEQLVSKIAGPSNNLLHHCHLHTQMKAYFLRAGSYKMEGQQNQYT
ncbi:intermembrane lipid transfer protein VPS13B-like isoform X2 [Mercenaria mercenaria]|uniref:intermembrane lipid transfer protein VPS13B-like isoform X2 n=1 Tax=Mercenaria mercenaria TaxID=6596 RepID=UPI00234E84ED|nr:intermembrane lipid transfer protein VPS13B-like isoform X2 [Mercenaria mercenaria]